MQSANLFDLIRERTGAPNQLALETSDATALTYSALIERALDALAVDDGGAVQHGADGKPESASFSNGMTETWTYNSDRSYQTAFAGVTGNPIRPRRSSMGPTASH